MSHALRIQENRYLFVCKLYYTYVYMYMSVYMYLNPLWDASPLITSMSLSSATTIGTSAHGVM